jgi:DNA repair exonuclease SbcCD ATPase subunit
MKRLLTSTFILFVLALVSGTAVAQTSDYQVKQQFERSYDELKVSIAGALSVDEVDSLVSQISNLKLEFENHEELLDHALYPETFSSSIKELQQEARNTEHKLLIIEGQDEKLTKLSDELASYRSEIAHLNSRTESLRAMITDSEKSERELSDLVQRYRNSMEQRDEFVLNMIDSLFVTYRDMEGSTFTELKEGDRSIKAGDNPLEVILAVIEENIQILKTDDGTLQTEDFLRMYVVQSRFNEVWSQIGDDLAAIYGGNNTLQWKANVEDKLGDWKASASKNMWASIDEYLEQNNVNLGAFDNNESFYEAIDSFISKATDASRDKVVTNENYADFQRFYDFWNTKIKSDWGKFVQEGEVLTMAQISSIDTEMMTWRDEAKPRSFMIPILFGLSLITIVGLIIVLARKN